MAKPLAPSVVQISAPGDLILAVSRMLGFTPSNSVAVCCLNDPRGRVQLVLRFDLVAAMQPTFADHISDRVGCAEADGVILVVFTDERPGDRGLPMAELVEPVCRAMGGLLRDMLLVVDDRWWSYLCDEPDCCPPEGSVIDPGSPGALSLAAAHTLLGHSVLPSREALAASIAYQGDDEHRARFAELVEAARARLAGELQPARRDAVRALLSRLSAASHDPKTPLHDADAAQLVALCEDVVVRDEVLIRGRKVARRLTLLRVLSAAARRVPSPYDAAVCASLAWLAYANGDGVIANIALDRTLETDPGYSLALLIDDALYRQIPPSALEAVMRDAARDLRSRG